MYGIGNYVRDLGELTTAEESARTEINRLTGYKPYFSMKQEQDLFEAMLQAGLVKWKGTDADRAKLTREMYAAAVLAATREDPKATKSTHDALVMKHLGVANAALSYQKQVVVAKADEAERQRQEAARTAEQAKKAKDEATRKALERKARAKAEAAARKQREAEREAAKLVDGTTAREAIEESAGGGKLPIVPIAAGLALLLLLR